MRFLVVLFALISMAVVSATTTSTYTTIWVTLTVDGTTTHSPAPYSQSMMSIVTDSADAAKPTKGSIGLGTISGNVGKVRKYIMTTITSSNNGASSRLSLSPSDRGLGIHNTMLIGLVSLLGLSVMFVF